MSLALLMYWKFNVRVYAQFRCERNYLVIFVFIIECAVGSTGRRRR